MGVRKKGGRKTRALALALSLFVLSSFLLWQGKPAGAATYTDTTDSDFALGTHENTENVSGDLRLKPGLTSGKFISRSLEGGANFFRWGTLSWDATLPTLFDQMEVNNVGQEPATLADGSPRIGEIAGGSYLDTRVEDGNYEILREINIGPAPYRYVQSETVYKGGTSGVSGAQGEDGNYENIYESLFRPFYYVEDPLESSTTDYQSYEDKVTLTFTPEPNSKYLIIASWLMANTSTTRRVMARLIRTTGTTKVFTELGYRPQDSSDYVSGVAMGIDTFGASPGSQTYKIQFRTTTDSSGTAKIKEARIFALRLSDLDNYAQSEGRSETTSTSWQDKTTLTFTPPSEGYYLILAAAVADQVNEGYDFKVQLTIDGTPYNTVNIEPVYYRSSSYNPWYPWGLAKMVYLTESSHTIKIQYCTESGGKAGIDNARIVALRLDQFSDYYYDEEEERTTTPSISYLNKLSLTEVPEAFDYLILGCAGIDGASTEYSSYVRMMRDNIPYGEMLIKPHDNTSQGFMYFSVKKENLAKASTTWRIQYRAENEQRPAGIKDARVAVLRLPLYRMDVQHNITGIPEADSYRLEIKYYTVGDQEPVGLYLYNFSTGSWEYQGDLEVGGSATNPYFFSLELESTYISGGEVRVRFVQEDDDYIPTSLMIDYVRVWCEPDYALRWQHTVENISTDYESYRVQVRGHTGGDSEGVNVYLWKNSTSSWEYVGSLDTTERTLIKDLPRSGPDNIASYLSGNNLYLKYESADDKDSTITFLYVDLCVVGEGNLYGSSVKFRVQVSTNNQNWSEEMGPDGTPNTYFERSPTSLENIPENYYLRYVVYLSSEHSQLTGENGPLVHEVTIRSVEEGKARIYTQEAKEVTWDSAILTARLLYLDPQAMVRFQYRKMGEPNWENTPWGGCEDKIYWERITGLLENTLYEFQAQVTYKGNIDNGGIRTFRTLPSKPVATPLKATLVDNESAVLNARIYYANYNSVSLKFWYRPSGGSWISTPPVTGYRATTYSCPISGLSSNTVYEWKVEIETTGENFVGENFVTFGSKILGMAYDGTLGLGSLPGWHGIRVENLPAGAKGMKLELLTSSPSYHSVRVVSDTGGLLYAGNFLSDNGRSKVVSVRFRKAAVAGENVYVEIYDPLGFAFRGRGTDNSMPLIRSGIRYSYSYLDRTGKNVRYYDRTCGLQVLEVYT